MNQLGQTGADWALLLLRLGIGLVFITHGFPKLTGWGKHPKASREHFAESLRRLRLPYPFYLAVFFGGVEFFGGAMVTVGLWAHWAASALAVIMLVASARNFAEKGFIGGADFPFSLLTTLIALIFLGSGSISLESFLFTGKTPAITKYPFQSAADLIDR